MDARTATAMAGHQHGLASILAIGCAGALATGMFFQFGLGYAPCSLCVLQRLAFVAVLLLALPLAAMKGPTVMARVLAPLLLAAVLAGLAVASYQVWMQAFPTGVARCGRGLAAYFEGLPLEDFASWVLAAEGDCEKPVRLLGVVSLAQLGLVAFALMTTLAVRMLVLMHRRPARP